MNGTYIEFRLSCSKLDRVCCQQSRKWELNGWYMASLSPSDPHHHCGAIAIYNLNFETQEKSFSFIYQNCDTLQLSLRLEERLRFRTNVCGHHLWLFELVILSEQATPRAVVPLATLGGLCSYHLLVWSCCIFWFFVWHHKVLLWWKEFYHKLLEAVADHRASERMLESARDSMIQM